MRAADLAPGQALVLFAGAADGWGLGLARAGYEVAALCEIDDWRRDACSRHPHNREAVAYADVRDLTAARLVRDLGYLPDVVVGSPPCQGASAANPLGRGLSDERTGLFSEFVRLVGEVRPAWACAENVPFIRARGIDDVLAGLEAIGYACWPLVVGSFHAGAPHRRRRLWLVAVRADVAAHADRHVLRLDQQLVSAGRTGALRDGRAPVARHPGPAVAGADAHRQGSPEHEGRGGNHGTEQPTALGVDWLDAWASWQGGCGRHLRMDARVSARLADDPDYGRAVASAYGDSVQPQLAEAIGRVMAGLLSPTLGEAARAPVPSPASPRPPTLDRGASP